MRRSCIVVLNCMKPDEPGSLAGSQSPSQRVLDCGPRLRPSATGAKAGSAAAWLLSPSVRVFPQSAKQTNLLVQPSNCRDLTHSGHVLSHAQLVRLPPPPFLLRLAEPPPACPATSRAHFDLANRTPS